MGLKTWLGFDETGDEEVDLSEYLEGLGLHEGELLDEDKYTYVKSVDADSSAVSADVEKELKKGNIVIVDTTKLSHSNKLLLKKLFDDLKRFEHEIDGDMGRVSETKILIVPSGYRILKRRVV